jgi:hypothetical protein
MAEGADFDGTNGSVGDHEIKSVNGEHGEEALRLAFCADDLDTLLRFQGGLDEAVGDEFGDGVSDSDLQAQGASRGTVFERVLHLAAEGKDFFGVAVNDTPHVGEDEAAALALEELLSQGIFEFANLAADGWLCEPKLVAGLGNTAFFGDCPEIEKVMVIQPFHTSL